MDIGQKPGEKVEVDFAGQALPSMICHEDK